MAIVSSREVVGIGLQSGIGTETTEYNAIPVEAGSFSAAESYEQILDTGRRGTDAMDFNSFQGVGSTEISFDMPMMYGADAIAGATGSVLGILVRNILGSGAAGETSNFGSPSAAEQRQSARREIVATSKTAWNTWFRLGKTQEYLTVARTLIGGTGDAHYKDCRVTSLTISSNAGEGPVAISATLMGQPPTVADEDIAATKTLSSNIALGFQNVHEGQTEYKPTLMGTTLYHNTDSNALNRIISFEVTLSRDATPIYTMSNTQNYNDLYLNPLEVTWNMVCEINNTDLALVRAGTGTGKTMVAFSKGTINDNSERSLIIGMAKNSMYESPVEIDTSGAYSTVSYSGRAITDNSALPLSGDDYDSDDATKRSPIEIRITEAGQDASVPPTYD